MGPFRCQAGPHEIQPGIQSPDSRRLDEAVVFLPTSGLMPAGRPSIRARSSGDLVLIPRDTPHDFTVMGQQAARYLLINTRLATEVAPALPAPNIHVCASYDMTSI